MGGRVWLALGVALAAICASRGNPVLPRWALDRNTEYLPPYTTFANRSESYVRPCVSSHCNGDGDCFELSDGRRVCECYTGKLGSNCELDDVCWLGGFCQNGGTCRMEQTNGGATPVCHCPHDSHGPRCESWTECEEPTCVADHTERCFQLRDGSHKCVCHGDRFGPRCEFVAEAGSTCADIQCQHGTCHYEVESRKPKCSCSEGFEGDDCSQPIDVCRSSPCAHGTCVAEPPAAQWRCECERGWAGLLCDEPFSPCSTHDCVHGTCFLVSGPNLFSQTCECYEGYEGERCSQKVGTDCRMRPCEHGGVCSEKPDGSVGCSCPHNWLRGDFCEYDMDECAFFSVEEAVCRNGGSCSNLAGGFLCHCMTGFTGDFCQTDEDDCSPDPCTNGGTCVDAGPVEYECQCPVDEGTGEHLFHGTHCEMPNSCYPSTGPDAKCKNGGTCLLSPDSLSFSCDCNNTWTGPTCEVDVDECEDERGQLLCREGGHRCVNTPGGFHCECKSELYHGQFCLDQEDICEAAAANPCQHNSTCVSQAEDPAELDQCICPPGFEGDLCELYPRCSSIECMNGSICFEDDRGVGSCHCPPGEILEKYSCTPEVHAVTPEDNTEDNKLLFMVILVILVLALVVPKERGISLVKVCFSALAEKIKCADNRRRHPISCGDSQLVEYSVHDYGQIAI